MYFSFQIMNQMSVTENIILMIYTVIMSVRTEIYAWLIGLKHVYVNDTGFGWQA